MTPRRLLLGGLLAWALTWLVNRSLVAVRGTSMLPTLRPGDRLLTLPARRWRLRPGQVLVVEDPSRPGHLVVKRLARVDHDRVVVLGDAPTSSTDSRVWGPLPRRAVRRVAVARWPGLTRTGLRAADTARQAGRRATTSSSGSSSATSPAGRRP